MELPSSGVQFGLQALKFCHRWKDSNAMKQSNAHNDLGVESFAEHENSWYSFKDFDGYRVREEPLFKRQKIRIVVVGAGACGLQFAYKAEKLLKNVEIQVYDKNPDVGGTWLENRYPGCTCDIPSHS